MNRADTKHRAERGRAVETARPEETERTVARVSKRRHGWCSALLLYVLICFLATACVSRKSSCFGSMVSSSCDYITTGPQVDNARFVFPTPTPAASPAPAPTPQLPSAAYWFRKGEAMEARWDSYIIYDSAPNTTCDPNKPAPPNCQRCNLANDKLPANECDLRFTPGNIHFLDVLAFDGFSTQATPTVLAGTANGWPDVWAKRLAFTPVGNATLRLQSLVDSQTLASFGSTHAEAKVFVVANGMSQTVQYQLTELKQTDPRTAGVTFYSGTLPVTLNPQMSLSGSITSQMGVSDNFSPNLQISAVRVVIGQRVTDSATGQLSLKDATPLKPSRLVFIPSYQNDYVYDHDNSRCYADYSTKPDGDFDLTRCRGQYHNSSSQLLGATPAYLKSDNGQQMLTWVAEFKPAEGGMIPPTPGPDQIVAIEFTIIAP